MKRQLLPETMLDTQKAENFSKSKNSWVSKMVFFYKYIIEIFFNLVRINPWGGGNVDCRRKTWERELVHWGDSDKTSEEKESRRKPFFGKEGGRGSLVTFILAIYFHESTTNTTDLRSKSASSAQRHFLLVSKEVSFLSQLRPLFVINSKWTRGINIWSLQIINKVLFHHLKRDQFCNVGFHCKTILN